MLGGVMPPAWMVDLEHALADDEGTDQLATALVVLASVAGREVPLDDEVAHGAARRALLLLSAGGDPTEGFDLNGRAVGARADDGRTSDPHHVLESGLPRRPLPAAGRPHVSEALHGLIHAPDIAWRAYAASILAEELADEG